MKPERSFWDRMLAPFGDRPVTARRSKHRSRNDDRRTAVPRGKQKRINRAANRRARRSRKVNAQIARRR